MATASRLEGKRTWTGLGSKRVRLNDALRVVLLTALVLVCLIPVVWTVLGSFKTPTELAQVPGSVLPESWSFTNYSQALKRFNFLGYITNSVIVTVGATILTLVINSMAAYPLISPAAATPTGVFLLRQYMLTIPDELIEAARVDGSGEFRTFLTVVLPLCKPALAVVAIFSVMWRWNDFLWPLVVAQSESVYTLPVALARFNAEETVPFNLILAMSVISILPVIVIFLFFQKQIATGIANTGIK